MVQMPRATHNSCSARSAGLCACALGLCAALATPSHAQTTISLSTIISDVHAQNPALAASRARIGAAHRQVDAAGRPEDPLVRVEVDRVGWARDASRPWIRYAVEQALPTPGLLGLEERVAERGVERSQAELATLRLSLDETAARAYLMLWRTQAELEVLASQNQVLEDLIAAALARMNSGADTHHDIIQSQVEELALQSQKTTVLADQKTALAMLAALRNRPQDEALVATEPLTLPASNETLSALETEAVHARSELQGMSAMAAEQQAMAALARRQTWPRFSVGAWYMQGLGMPDAVGLMVAATVPVFTRPRQSALAAEADARAEAAHQERFSLELLVRAEVRSAHARFTAAGERVKLLQEAAVPRAEQALLQSQSSYRAGMAMPFASVLQDRRALTELRMQLVAAEAERYEAYLALWRALGRDLAQSAVH